MSMFDRIVEYASRQLEIPAEEITRDTTFESLGVDSLDIVEMTMDFEAELGVELDMEAQRSPPLANWPIILTSG